MFCRYCGKQIPTDSIFCPLCGKMIGTPSISTGGSATNRDSTAS